MRKLHPAWKEQPLRTSLRVALSLVRRKLPSLRRTVVAYDAGRSRIAVDLKTVLGLSLYRYRSTDPEVEFVASLLGKGDLFVDGGANVGLFSLAAAARVGPRGKVIAFEPATATRRHLAENVALNHFVWVDVRSEALADHAGDMELTVFERDLDGLSSFAPAEPGGRRERVRTITLDAALSPADAARVRVVKLDLEGAELAALRGGLGLLEQSAPDLFVEVEPEHLGRQQASAAAVFSLLEALGYQFFRVVRGRDRTPTLVPLGKAELETWRGGNVLATQRSDVIRRSDLVERQEVIERQER